jgi:hypothetical protein
MTMIIYETLLIRYWGDLINLYTSKAPTLREEQALQSPNFGGSRTQSPQSWGSGGHAVILSHMQINRAGLFAHVFWFTESTVKLL